MNVIDSSVPYTYSILKKDIKNLSSKYNFLECMSIGTSILSNNIYCLKIGVGNKNLFYSASIHANEWITSTLLMKFLEDYCFGLINNSYEFTFLYNNFTLYIAPMLNPDGVNLVNGIYPSDSNLYLSTQNIASKYPDIPFPSGWKSNIRGIDLNLQFPANWEKAQNIKYKKGFTSPSPRDFVGCSPLSEPEAKSIYNFTLKNDFDLILSFHSQGEVIYWKYDNFNPRNSYEIGKFLSDSSGYSLDLTPPESSYAGYKDWFIYHFNKPGYTIEVGYGENPLPISDFDSIYFNIKKMLLSISQKEVLGLLS